MVTLELKDYDKLRVTYKGESSTSGSSYFAAFLLG